MQSLSLTNFIRNNIDIADKDANDIAGNFEFKEWAKGETFLREGKVSNEYLFLEKGFMRAFLYDTDGNEVTTSFYTEKNVVFEVASFFQRVPTQENIHALTDCSGWTITYEQLNVLFHTIPAFREFGRAMLVKGFVALKVRTLAMINQTAEQRYANLLKANPEIFQHAALKMIASYLGITDTSLSRIRKDFSRK